MNATDDEIKEIMDKFSYDNSQQIHYSEFLAATIHIELDDITEERREAVF